MNNPIAITNNTVNGEDVQTVNARDLHAFLEAKRDFSNWIKDRISRYNFIEGQDFVKTQDCGHQIWRAQNLDLLLQLIII